MAKIIELRKAIATKLLAIHPRVYYKKAPVSAEYPYLVYDLPNSVDDGTLENFVLDVDGWDNKESTTALETLMNNADAALHRQSIYDSGNICVTFYRENRLSPTDEDAAINRRKYIYQARTY